VIALIEEAVTAPPGSILFPKARAIRMGDLAQAISSKIVVIGARPGESRHQALAIRPEAVVDTSAGWYYQIAPRGAQAWGRSYSSAEFCTLTAEEVLG